MPDLAQPIYVALDRHSMNVTPEVAAIL